MHRLFYIYKHTVVYSPDYYNSLLDYSVSKESAWVRFLGQEDLLEKEMATHANILAWRIPWTEEPGGLESMATQRVRYDWGTKDSTQYREKQEPFELKNMSLLYLFKWKRHACAWIPGHLGWHLGWGKKHQGPPRISISLNQSRNMKAKGLWACGESRALLCQCW